MRVGIVSYSDTDQAFDLGFDLHQVGADVHLYLSTKHVLRALDTSENPVQRIYEKGIVDPDCGLKLFSYPRMRDPRSFRTIYKISREIRKDKVDVVNILMGPGELWLALLAYFLDKPIVTTIIVPQPNIGDELYHWVVPFYRILTRKSQAIIVNGKNQVDLVSRLYRFPHNLIFHVPLGARTTAVKWNLRRKKEKAGSILLFGRMTKQKGVEFILKAAPIIGAQIPDARIIIAGHGEELTRCRNMVNKPANVEFHEGYFSGDIMADYFEEASLVVLPYLTASTSGVLLTAFGFGKPVVATRVGCLPEYVIDGETGFLIPPSDPQKLANAIIRLLSDEGLRQKMGKNARIWVEDANTQIASITLKVYESVLTLKNEQCLPEKIGVAHG